LARNCHYDKKCHTIISCILLFYLNNKCGIIIALYIIEVLSNSGVGMKENYNHIITLFSCCTILVLQLRAIQRKYAAGIAGTMSSLHKKSGRYNGGEVSRTTCSDPTPGSVDQNQQETWNNSLIGFYPYSRRNTKQFLPPYLLPFYQQYVNHIRKTGTGLLTATMKKTKQLFSQAESSVHKFLRQITQKNRWFYPAPGDDYEKTN
jgi:hypothetical protein